MKQFGRLLKTYGDKVLRGGSSQAKLTDVVWPSITQKVMGFSAGRPYKVSKDTIFIECDSSEEMARVKVFETPLIMELRKEFSPNIKMLQITTKKIV